MINLLFTFASAILGVAMFATILLPSTASAATSTPEASPIYAGGDSTTKPQPATDDEPAVQIADLQR